MSEEIKNIILDVKDSLNETPKNMYKYNKITLNLNEFEEILNYIEQLEKRCEYLERSNNRREDEIIELRDENVDLVSKNEQLENIRKEAIEYVTKKWYSKNTEDINKMVSFGNWEIDLLNILNKGSEDK